MRSWRALIVDDERLARKDLRKLLGAHKNIEIIGEATSGTAALEQIKELAPDLVFLDIQMPGMTGFELLEQIDSSIQIIFVTAFDEYALRAFEVNALDYLLKPISPARLAESLLRLEEEPADEDLDETPRLLEISDRLLIRMDNHFRFLKVADICCIQSAGDYSEIITRENRKHLIYKSMTEWEQRLPINTFCRIHRSTIINLDRLEKLEEWFNHSYRVYLTDVEEPYIMSRRYATKLKKLMS